MEGGSRFSPPSKIKEIESAGLTAEKWGMSNISEQFCEVQLKKSHFKRALI